MSKMLSLQKEQLCDLLPVCQIQHRVSKLVLAVHMLCRPTYRRECTLKVCVMMFDDIVGQLLHEALLL